MSGAHPEPVASSAPPTARSGRRTLLFVATIAIAPVVASYAAFYLLRNPAKTNYGVLLPTAPAPALAGERLDGTSFRLTDLHGQWVLLVAAGGRCDAVCERELYATRQARTMQGPEQERIARLWLVTDDAVPAKTLLDAHPGLVVARVAAGAIATLPSGAGAIYLIDPLGNVVLRYGDNPDITGVSRDLGHLLKASRIG